MDIRKPFGKPGFHMIPTFATEEIADVETFVEQIQRYIFCVRARKSAVTISGWRLNLPHLGKISLKHQTFLWHLIKKFTPSVTWYYIHSQKPN